jgi:hypothetical protein
MLAAALTIVEQYAANWRFDINHDKSNVVVFGSKKIQSLARTRSWALAAKSIAVADSYKYLGVEFLSKRNHGKWNVYLDRILSKALTGTTLLMYQGGGTTGQRPRTLVKLWMAKVRPALEYGSELWEGEISLKYQNKLESIQNKFGRAVLGITTNVAAVGVRAELGLPTLKSRRQCLKLGYWKKLCEAAPNRLLSVIFRNRYAEVSAGRAAHSCLQAFKQTLHDLDLDYFWSSMSASNDWSVVVRSKSVALQASAQDAMIASHSSLATFALLGQRCSDGTHPYLNDTYNRLGMRLKTNLRLGTLMLMQRVAAGMGWPVRAGRCLLCKSGAIEDAQHFLVSCPALEVARSELRSIAVETLAQAGMPGAYLAARLCSSMSRGSTDAVVLLLGGKHSFPACPSGHEEDDWTEGCGKASWLCDKVSKNYILRCWRLRQARLGVVTIKAGCVVQTPPVRSVGQTCSNLPRVRETLSNAAEYRSQWLEWRPRASAAGQLLVPRRSPRKNFYVVWRGRAPGLYYRWYDVRKSVAGFKDPVYKGFDSFEEAVGALRACRSCWLIVHQRMYFLVPDIADWVML